MPPGVIRFVILLVAAASGLVLAWALLVWAPPVLVGERGLEPKDQVAAEGAARTDLISAVGGTVLVAGLLFTARTYQSSREGQVTDRYTAAVNQLGNTEVAVRLGGIYALERIAVDSARDRTTIIEILAALIRAASRPTDAETPSAEVTAALSVLSRLPGANQPRTLDLRGSDLRGLRLEGLRLAGADLSGARLDGAHIPGANLQRTKLDRVVAPKVTLTLADLRNVVATGAKFAGAYLDQVDLRNADIHGGEFQACSMRGIDGRHATLESAHLDLAQLQAADDGTPTRLAGAWLTKAVLAKANVAGVDLGGVLGLTKAQHDAAHSDASTKWPDLS